MAVLIRSYTRTLKQIHYLSKVFKFVFTLFNLQGTVFARYRKPDWARRELLYLITSFRTCQELFSSFSKFFQMWVALQVFVVHHTTFLLYLRTFHLSRTFFKFFQISFSFGIFFAALADSLDILPLHFQFVKHFFTKKFIIFCVQSLWSTVRIWRTVFNLGWTGRC